jgi:hypothetical protein
VQPFAATNSAGALLATLEMVTGVPPVLVTVIDIGALVVPTNCVGNVSEGVSVS